MFQHAWKLITDDRWVHSVIGEGFRIPFHMPPPMTHSPLASPYLSQAEKIAIEKEVLALLAKKAIEHATGPGFQSRLFTIPKKTGDLRPVLNLRPLNTYVRPESFKMETVQTVCSTMLKNDYLTSIDLKDAFLHILISPAFRKYLQFEWKGNLYQFRTLPFGLSLSPLVFTKILRPLLRWARRRGIRLSAYLDDLLIMARSKELSLLHTRLIRGKLTELGFLINEEKSSMTPSQTLDHLGFTFNTKNMTLSVPGSKLRDLRREATKILHKGATSVRNLSTFIGKAMATTIAVFPARLMTRHLLSLKNMALRRPSATWEDMIQMDHKASEELQWWMSSLRDWNGTSWVQSPTQLDVFTDASDTGWGIVIGRQTWSGTWTPAEKASHINWKELQVVYLATTLSKTQGKVLNLICDNTTTIAYINKFGGTRSPLLMELADKIWRHCLNTGTRLRTTYVPSAFNPADAPSRRLQSQLEWSIHPTFFRQLDQLWGPHHTDLFASADNHQLPRFMTWRPHPLAIKNNAMIHRWSDMGNLYICPPWNLLPRVLQKLTEERLEATLVTPFWPSAIWFPRVQAMSICRPIPIPRACVLPPPGSANNILEKNPHWGLTAWRISGYA
jgi:hypothetical protein